MKLKTLVTALSLAISCNALANFPATDFTAAASKVTKHTAGINSALTPISKTSLTGMPGAVGLQGSVDATGLDCSVFIGLSGASLLTEIQQVEVDCLSGLFSLTRSDAVSVFNETNVGTVVTAVKAHAANYQGVDDAEINQLLYFLQAAAFVQYYEDDYIPAYSARLIAEVKQALTTIFNNQHLWIASKDNASILSTALVVQDSFGLRAEFVHIWLKVLNEFDASWIDIWEMAGAANQVFVNLFRAKDDAKVRAIFESDHRILDALNDFQLSNRQLLGGYDEYVLINAVLELNRLFYVDSMREKVRVISQALLDSSNKDDDTKAIWLSTASMVTYTDPANCNSYNTCGYALQLEAEVLDFNWKCSDSLKIRAQHMYQDQARWACGVLGEQEGYFHTKLSTGNVPVADDHNSALELVIFDSSGDYVDYAGTFFDINTNNGGMYLEGAPGVTGNQARFLAYEAQWERPEFHIWNLQHEYVHYLDARFNLYGDFNYGNADTVWWAEGLAEYISVKDANSSALKLAETAEYALSEIFNNDYNGSQDRIYRWGYLAVRFMFEKHPDMVNQLLSFVRNDQFDQYQNLLDNTIGTSFDNEWFGWLSSGLNTDLDGIVPNGPSDTDAADSGTASNSPAPIRLVSTDYSACVVSDEANRYDYDESRIYINSQAECIYSRGNGVSLTIPNPGKLEQDVWLKIGGGWGNADIMLRSGGWPSASRNDGASNGPGNYEVLKVTLKQGEYWNYVKLPGNFGAVSLEVSTSELFADQDPAFPTQTGCTAPSIDGGRLEFDIEECLDSGRTRYYIEVEEEGTPITITTSGGTGEADIFFNQDTWASESVNTGSATGAGNDHTLVVIARRGYNFISIDTHSEYANVSLKVTQGGEVPEPDTTIDDVCQTQAPQSYAELLDGQALCATGSFSEYYLWVDAGTTSLEISSHHGTGDISLYGAHGNWATPNSFEQASVTDGSTKESFTVTNPQEGWYYVTVEGEPTIEGVAVQATFN